MFNHLPPPPSPFENRAQITTVMRDAEPAARTGIDFSDCFRTAELPPRLIAFEPTAIPLSLAHEARISNRPAQQELHLIYVNGISTERNYVDQAVALAKRSSGAEENEVQIIYNAPESTVATSVVKIFGGLISSRLGDHAESDCIKGVRSEICSAIDNPNRRTILVAHSQGSLIVQNALDRAFDEYNKTGDNRKKWNEHAPKIEIYLYAPLISETVPGPKVVALSNCCDLPARSLTGISYTITASKSCTGWREYTPIRTELYQSKGSGYSDVLFNPSQVHGAISLITNDIEFNYQLLSKPPKSKNFNAEYFANNLAESISKGNRSDLLHQELIVLGCERGGAPFAQAFLKHLRTDTRLNSATIDKFSIDSAQLDRILHTARPADK